MNLHHSPSAALGATVSRQTWIWAGEVGGEGLACSRRCGWEPAPWAAGGHSVRVAI